MEPNSSHDHIEAFAVELLRTGMCLSDVAADLIESIPPDAYPGEEPGSVVLSMMIGTIRTVLGPLEPRLIEQAKELIDLAAEQVREHLQLALALSKRMTGEDGRTYG